MVATSINLTDFGHPRPLLPPDLLPGAPQPDSLLAPDTRDSALFSLPQSPQQLSMQWDDPAPSVNAGSTPFHGFECRGFFYDGYGQYFDLVRFNPVKCPIPVSISWEISDLEKAKIGEGNTGSVYDEESRTPVPQVVFAPNASVGASTSNATALGMTAALLTPASSELLAAAATVSQDGSDVAAPVSSNKRQKKVEDSLAGWVMQDPDTGEKLAGYEWVKRYPEEFAQRYKKDHQRYLDYFAQYLSIIFSYTHNSMHNKLSQSLVHFQNCSATR
ncbi:hypothetical protein B0H13DRAFT_2266267 [Mycena leptocephala]|nr:hypothetical protein B0H13DRAFT_2266267 [Mycena leptocephala]